MKKNQNMMDKKKKTQQKLIRIQSLNIKENQNIKSHEVTFVCETTTTDANDRSHT